MSYKQAVWIDIERCTGCGACLEVCPVSAISLVGDRAHIDEEICTACGACVEVCREDAIQPVIRGEIVPAERQPLPTVRPPSPLAETAGAAVVATGVGLLAKAGGALGRAVGRWLARPSAGTRPSGAKAPPTAKGRGAAGRGRQGRHRRRGR